MNSVEWVEVSGKTVDIAVEYGLKELGLESRDQAEVEVLSEGEKGFLGLGGKDAVVRIKPKPSGRKRRRRRKPKGGGGSDSSGGGGQSGSTAGQHASRGQSKSGNRDGGKAAGGRGSTGQRNGSSQGGRRDGVQDQGRNNGGRRGQSESGRGGGNDRSRRDTRKKEPSVPTQEQADVVKEFLEGLVGAFGLEGNVEVRIDDEALIADVIGDQTEAMVGPRGSVIEAIHEITKTVLLRKTGESARLRLDVAGHAERRRQALAIYANQLIDQVLGEGGEVVLEPMSAADRKVIHDAAAARDGVRSYSEGEAPRRYVVLAADAAPEIVSEDEDSAGDDDGGGSEEE